MSVAYKILHSVCGLTDSSLGKYNHDPVWPCVQETLDEFERRKILLILNFLHFQMRNFLTIWFVQMCET